MNTVPHRFLSSPEKVLNLQDEIVRIESPSITRSIRHLGVLTDNRKKHIMRIQRTLGSDIPELSKIEWIKRDLILDFDGHKILIDSKLKSIYDEIILSQKLLSLKDGWDDEGALGCNEKIYKRAIDLLLNYSIDILRIYNIAISAPEINLGKDGSIDLEWRDSNYVLLINILNSDKYEIHYYGEDYNKRNIIKGFLDNNIVNDDLAFWMQKLV